jgi:DNA sulfur modification protein DndE
MALETVRITQQGREQLSRLKRYTGIENWNVLCRWSFCVSLAEPTLPPSKAFKGDAAVEMTWKVFGGPYQEVYLALLKERCKRDGFDLSDQTLAEQLRLHIHRGLGYLAANRGLRRIRDLVSLPLEPDAAQASGG